AEVAVETLEAITAIRQSRIRLARRANAQLGRRDPCHDEHAPLADGDRIAAERERVREGRRPDVDVETAVELRQRARLTVPPIALSVALELQRPGLVLRGHDEPRIGHAPRCIPGEPIAETEGPTVLIAGENQATGRA